MIAYKFLRRDGTGAFTRYPWPLPGPDAPGSWVQAPVIACRSGIHACRLRDLPLWLGRELYEVELDGQIVEESTPEEFFTAPKSDRARDFLSKILTH